jgi:hypothetical protein
MERSPSKINLTDGLNPKSTIEPFKLCDGDNLTITANTFDYFVDCIYKRCGEKLNQCVSGVLIVIKDEELVFDQVCASKERGCTSASILFKEETTGNQYKVTKDTNCDEGDANCLRIRKKIPSNLEYDDGRSRYAMRLSRLVEHKSSRDSTTGTAVGGKKKKQGAKTSKKKQGAKTSKKKQGAKKSKKKQSAKKSKKKQSAKKSKKKQSAKK